MTASGAPLLQVSHLQHRYEDGTPTLRGVDFSVCEGEKIAIVGANGAGKSTLLQLLAGCLVPAEGEIRLGGESPHADLPAARRQIGLVFQDADDQLFMPTVWEDVAFGLAGRGVPVDALKEQALAILHGLHAAHLAMRAPHRLSGGEKRVAAMATALAMSPRIMVLDEPTAALDPRARRHLIGLLKALELTLIVAAHDLDMVLDVCDRVLILKDGRIAAQSAVPGCLADSILLRDCGLEPPLRYEHAAI